MHKVIPGNEVRGRKGVIVVIIKILKKIRYRIRAVLCVLRRTVFSPLYKIKIPFNRENIFFETLLNWEKEPVYTAMVEIFMWKGIP